jgi:hypothetical protein
LFVCLSVWFSPFLFLLSPSTQLTRSLLPNSFHFPFFF